MTDTGFDKRAGWLGEGDDALFAWLYTPRVGVRDTAVVLCPPLGFEYVHCHRSYRHLAEILAGAGFPVVRFDFSGTGDAGSDMLAEHCFERWQNNIHSIAGLLKTCGVVKIALFGIRLGATLAVLAGQKQAYDFCIGWNPVWKGKRYARELQAISLTSANGSGDSTQGMEVAGFVWGNPLLQELKASNLDTRALSTFGKSLLLIDEDTQTDAAPDNVTLLPASGFSAMMEEPQFSKVPDETFNGVCDWLTDHSAHGRFDPAPWLAQLSDTLTLNGVQETIHDQGVPLFSISARPAGDQTIERVVVLVNSGAVHHVGPNRLYVYLARQLAASGALVLRIDLSHLGDACVGSPAGENHPYARTAVDDVERFAFWVKSHWPTLPLTLAGVCSGSYTAFYAGLKLDKSVLDQVVVINPLTFNWHEGLTLETPKSGDVNRDAKQYGASVLSAKSWKKFLSGKAQYRYIAGFILRLAFSTFKNRSKELLQILHLKAKPPLAAKIDQILKSGKKLDFVFSSTDPGYGLLMEGGGHFVRKYRNQGKFGIDFIKGADHTFTREQHRLALARSLAKLRPDGA